MALKEYTAKRTFERTPEPAPAAAPGIGGHTFVVHKHAARALQLAAELNMPTILAAARELAYAR